MAQENDIVLIYFEDKPLSFARIEQISPDIKKDWYNVKLMILQVPVHAVTWILRSAYIDGEEFTMGGKRMRLERVICPEDPNDTYEDKQNDERKEKSLPTISSGGAKIISFPTRKKT